LHMSLTISKRVLPEMSKNLMDKMHGNFKICSISCTIASITYHSFHCSSKQPACSCTPRQRRKDIE
jgi:hypothetical protein